MSDRGGRGGRGGGGFSGKGRGKGGRGSGGTDTGRVAAGVQSMSFGDQPTPLPFSPPKEGEQDGYKAAAKPLPALRQGKRVFDVIFNTWELDCTDSLVYAYDVSVGLEAIGNDGSTRIFNVNKGPKDDASNSERNELIRETIRAGLEMHRILSNSGAHISDGGSLMFTNENIDAAFKPHNNTIKVPVDKLSLDVQKLIRNSNKKNLIIEITGSKSFNVKDLSGMINVDRTEIDQTVKQFIEILTSDYAVMTHNYDSFTGGKLYRSDPVGHSKGLNRFAENVKFGQERRPGMFKGMALVDREGSTFAALNIDATTGTFWREGQLDKAIMEINGWRTVNDAKWDARAVIRTNEMIKGLRVAYTSTEGNSTFDFLVSGITARASESTDGSLSVNVTTIEQQMCKNAQGIMEPVKNKFSSVNLKLNKWPLVVSTRSRRKTDDPTKFEVDTQYFPIELLQIKRNQRVSLKKQGAAPVRAMRVDARWTQTHNDLEALNLFADTRGPTINSVLKAFGINVIRKPLGTKAFTRRMAEISVKEQRTNAKKNVNVNEKTNFDTRYSVFETAAHITYLHIAFSKDPSFDKTEFTRNFVSAAKNKGIKIDHFHSEIVPPADLHNCMLAINEKRKTASNMKNTIFMYIEPEAGKHHDELKLFERRFCIVTQHLKMENAAELAYKKVMMENILLKLNVKGGGHNYNVKPEIFAMPLWMEKQTMIMGYDVSHPTGQTRAEKMADRLPDPSVVGFSFNGGVNPDSFIGDYHFQQPTKERVHDDVLNARIKWMLLTFEMSRGVLPPLIIVVRDGISDGQYSHGMDELAALREGASEYAVSKARTDKTKKPPKPDYAPKFIFVVATKRHHKRIYVENGRFHHNMPAMSAVDDTITNPSLFEFFLQSHTPLQMEDSNTGGPAASTPSMPPPCMPPSVSIRPMMRARRRLWEVPEKARSHPDGTLFRYGSIIMFTAQVGMIVEWRGERGYMSFVYSPVSGFVRIPRMKMFSRPAGMALDYSCFPPADRELAYWQPPCEWLCTGSMVKYDCYKISQGCWYATALEKFDGEAVGICSSPITRDLSPLEFCVRGVALSRGFYRGKPYLLLWNDSIGRISLFDGAYTDVDPFDVIECVASFVPRASSRRREDVPWEASDARYEAPTVITDPAFSCKTLHTSDGWKIVNKDDLSKVRLRRDDQEVFACFDDFQTECEATCICEWFVNGAWAFRVTWVEQIGDGIPYKLALLLTAVAKCGATRMHHPIYESGSIIDDPYTGCDDDTFC